MECDNQQKLFHLTIYSLFSIVETISLQVFKYKFNLNSIIY